MDLADHTDSDSPSAERLTPELPTSLHAPISPPPSRSRRAKSKNATNKPPPPPSSIEAGTALIHNHLAYWTSHLSRAIPPSPLPAPLSVKDLTTLYEAHSGSAQGHHFVVHQHDHPVAGLHYDLRLQINETSSASWAIMYGMPGNANSKRISRNAMETRVHCLWNHLIETASVQTGSMLIWDTGAYEVLPYQSSNVEADLETTDEDEDDSEEERSMHGTPEYSSLRTEQEKLAQAFDNRKIRLRLHGARLPKDYTISLRLSSQEDRSQQPKAPSRKRKRGQSNLKKTTSQTKAQAIHPRNDESSSDAETTASDYPDEGSRDGANGKPNVEGDEESRITNTYPGASNTINSIYQRRWYLNFDRRSSGFIPQMKWEGERKRIWARKRRKDGALDGFEPFRVMGAEIERSIVTGRTAKQVLVDEGVSGYESRRGWRAVVE